MSLFWIIALAITIGPFLIALGYYVIVIAISLFIPDRNDNDYKSLNKIGSIFKAMGIIEAEEIPLEISKENFKRGIEKYYEILENVFDSETKEERKSNFIPSPSEKLNKIFFEKTGLGKSLNILTKDISSVMVGSGWIEDKRILKDSLNKGRLIIRKSSDKKFKILFNEDLYMEIEEDIADYNTDIETWDVCVYYKKKIVLNCYVTEGDEPHMFTFKPDLWMLEIRNVANKYAIGLETMKLKKATESKKSKLFR